VPTRSLAIDLEDFESDPNDYSHLDHAEKKETLNQSLSFRQNGRKLKPKI
jgi:hypothetical protein